MFIDRQQDNTVRWKSGERLHHLFESMCRNFEKQEIRDHAAVDFGRMPLSYLELDQRANQLAHHLRRRGTKPGDRIAILLERSPELYVSILGILKAGAAFVPLDAAFPKDRLQFIIQDANIATILSNSEFAAKIEELPARAMFLDLAAGAIATEPVSPINQKDAQATADDLAYVIYTSGTTGRPKGVAINHSSICNFVRVAAPVYGYRPADRVYQGMSIIFDFSFEEILVPLVAGATLVPAPPGKPLLGTDLYDYLSARRVTVLCCVPMLLASMSGDLPELNLILLGGEACPQDLVGRWYREGRRILNTYGPTEATITASVAELHPRRPVTIGAPLPSYSLVVLDPGTLEPVPDGDLGEICIAGAGLASHYVNLPDLTCDKFIPDFLSLPNNPSGRIYRTGDLGRVVEDGEIQYLGRIDRQVKLNGYRIELTEIESVMMEYRTFSQVVVEAVEITPGCRELVAYYTKNAAAGELDRADLKRFLASRLPRYMIPSFVEELAELPMMLSNKVDRKSLPCPRGQRLSCNSKKIVAPETETERILCDALSVVLGTKDISAEDDFFEDLGANSLLLARYCALVRQQRPQTTISMQDIYKCPSVRKLATRIEQEPAVKSLQLASENAYRPSALSYWTCGFFQTLYQAAYVSVLFAMVRTGYIYCSAAQSAIELYWRTVLYGIVVFVLLLFVPIVLKWIVMGRFRVEAIPLWSLQYFRFWVVKQLIQTSPAAVFKGTPLFNLYLRMLGAKVSLTAFVEPRVTPVCTDLVSIGVNAVVRRDALILGYKAKDNMIQVGPILIGDGAFIGEGSVIDIHTSIGAEAQLGHSSSVHEGQSLEPNRRYHGSPAIETDSIYRRLDNKELPKLRRTVFSVFQLIGFFFVGLPVPVLILAVFAIDYAQMFGDLSMASLLETPASFLQSILPFTLSFYLGTTLFALAFIVAVPRILSVFLEEGRVYFLYGAKYFIYRALRSASNSRPLNTLFGDSVFITSFLTAIGYNLNKVIQSGSNFGVEQSHDSPLLCDIGSGTMVSDGLLMTNMRASATSFQMLKTSVAGSNFLGNDVRMFPEARTGNNCLLATKVMVPIDGPVWENAGLLGSPCFAIPRIVERDAQLLAQYSGTQRASLIRLKTKSNIVTIALFMLSWWMYASGLLVLIMLAEHFYETYGLIGWFVMLGAMVLYSFAHWVLVERASLSFRHLTPGMFSIYDPRFWQVELYWKLSSTPLMQMCKGTPLRSVILRSLGVRVGKMVFDDGAMMTERTLVSIGDACNLNEGVTLQSHSLEEGVFKSDHIIIGNGCNLEPASFVHYGVNMKDRVTLQSDSFLMKGEFLDQRTIWRGNPARAI